MKLSEQEALSIRAETGMEPLPEAAPSQATLETHFGEHTFYVADQGLFVFEPVTDSDDGADAADKARAVQLAVWAEQDGRRALAPIEPQPTELIANLKAA